MLEAAWGCHLEKPTVVLDRVSGKGETNMSKGGNAASRAFEAMQARAAGTLTLVDIRLEALEEEGLSFEGLSCRAPLGEDKPDWLVIGRAWRGADKLVAFHSAPTFIEAVVGFWDRVYNRSIKWSDDQWQGKS